MLNVSDSNLCAKTAPTPTILAKSVDSACFVYVKISSTVVQITGIGLLSSLMHLSLFKSARKVRKLVTRWTLVSAISAEIQYLISVKFSTGMHYYISYTATGHLHIWPRLRGCRAAGLRSVAQTLIIFAYAVYETKLFESPPTAPCTV